MKENLLLLKDLLKNKNLKNKICKCRTSMSKNVYIDKLDDIVNKYSNTYHRVIKMNPIDVKNNTDINTDEETNNKKPKFKVGDRVRISKYKKNFAKDYTPNCSEEIFAIKETKNINVINDLNGEQERKGNKLYAK